MQEPYSYASSSSDDGGKYSDGNDVADFGGTAGGASSLGKAHGNLVATPPRVPHSLASGAAARASASSSDDGSPTSDGRPSSFGPVRASAGASSFDGGRRSEHAASSLGWASVTTPQRMPVRSSQEGCY